jgi:hypothetical protein
MFDQPTAVAPAHIRPSTDLRQLTHFITSLRVL